MNPYEVAVLRILVKNRTGMRKLQIIDGFPDDSKDSVALAISNLYNQGFVLIDSDLVALNKEKRMEAMRIINPDFQISGNSNHGGSSSNKQLAWLPIMMAMVAVGIATVFAMSFNPQANYGYNAAPAADVVTFRYNDVNAIEVAPMHYNVRIVYPEQEYAALEPITYHIVPIEGCNIISQDDGTTAAPAECQTIELKLASQ